MSAHAFLSASGSSKWLNCPPSARLESHFPDKGSEYAAEGTLAHEVAELRLRYLNLEILQDEYEKRLRAVEADPRYSVSMNDYISDYVDTVWERYSCLQAENNGLAYLFIEQKLDFSPWVSEGFGTGDVIIIAGDTIEVIDLKYGKGVPVSAENNSQMRLYGLGAYNNFGLLYEFKNVAMTIVQPRLDSISSETLTLNELLAWGEAVKVTAKMAMKGEGEYGVGDHCRFCRASATCRHLADYNLEIAKYAFAEADLLSDAEVSDILMRAGAFTKWIDALQKYALDAAVNTGKKWTGMKLVEGRSNRKITDPEIMAEILRNEGYADETIYKPTELRSLTDLESLTGKKKFRELTVGLIEKPPGKPTLVTEKDKRPEWAPEKSIIDQFEEE